MSGIELVTQIAGWIGGFCFTVCGIPLVIEAYKENKIPPCSFLVLWGGGIICTLIYVVLGNWQIGHWQIPLIVNYSFNIVLLVLLVFKKVQIKLTNQLNTTTIS